MKKRIFTAVFILLVTALAAACGASVDDTSPATVRLTVDTPAESVTVVSSSGTVEGEGKVFTVSLPDRRGAVVTVSADGYETVTLRFDAADFAAGDAIERTVALAAPNTAVLQVSVANGVPATVTARGSDTEYTAVKSGSRYTVTVPGRAGLNAEITVSADGYEPYTLRVTEADLKSGVWYGSVRLVRAGYKLVETYGYYDTAFTRDYTILSGTRGEYIGENIEPPVYFELPENGTVILRKSSESGVTLVRAAELPAYGTTYRCGTVRGSGETLYVLNETFDGESLYYTNWYFSADGGSLENVTPYETVYGEESFRRCWAFDLPGDGTLYTLEYYSEEVAEGQWEMRCAVRAYAVTADRLSASRRDPVYLDESVDGGTDGAVTPKVRDDAPVLDIFIDTDGRPVDNTAEDFDDRYKKVKEELYVHTDAADMMTVERRYIYTETITFRFTLDGYRPGQDYDAVAAGEQDEYYHIGLYSSGSYTLTYDESRVTVLEIESLFTDGTIGFTLFRSALVPGIGGGYQSIEVGSEMFCYAEDELTAAGDTYTYPDTIDLHDYVHMEDYGQYYDYFYEFVPGLIAGEYPDLADDAWRIEDCMFAADGAMTVNLEWYFPAEAMVTVKVTYEGDKGESGYTIVTAESAPVRAYDFVVAFERLRMSGYVEPEMPALEWTFTVSQRQ